MIARPKISRNERKTTEIGAFEVGNFALLSCPGWGLLSEAEADLVEARGWSGVLRSVGVAGLRDPTTVKCLHAHYAHWLGTRENPVGAWVHAHLPDDVRAFAVPD